MQRCTFVKLNCVSRQVENIAVNNQTIMHVHYIPFEIFLDWGLIITIFPGGARGKFWKEPLRGNKPAFSIYKMFDKHPRDLPSPFRMRIPSPRTILRYLNFPLMVKAIQGLTVNRGWRQDSHPLPFEMFNQILHGEVHFQIRRRHAQ